MKKLKRKRMVPYTCYSCFVINYIPYFVFDSDMGVQVDGFPAVVAHTLVIGASKV